MLGIFCHVKICKKKNYHKVFNVHPSPHADVFLGYLWPYQIDIANWYKYGGASNVLKSVPENPYAAPDTNYKCAHEYFPQIQFSSDRMHLMLGKGTTTLMVLCPYQPPTKRRFWAKTVVALCDVIHQKEDFVSLVWQKLSRLFRPI